MTITLAENSAADVASAVADSVQYHGRKAIRRGSEQRRQAILDAAMRIIVRDGVRAVRHRAIAAEAGVPLSATTYYFKDINDLITDTFAQYVERSAAQLGEFWERTHGLLPPPDERGSLASRRMLVDQVAKLAVDYVLTQLLTRRDELVADQAFRQEALRNPHLSEMVRAHRQILDRGITHLFELLGSPLPHQDARLLTAIITQMEYQGLLDGVERLDCDEMLAVFKRYMHLVLELNVSDAARSVEARLARV